nr:immunoglobulin light chain junction region [Macaca mulatta]MOY05060.1 immunoglobulin light chain junction region [Macaca mulatta]MOY05141.1 immunoglobulin light chain junction region [Macaca mulatta]MOY05231.1 immunoglobulin light chain junction region [Macaca mulatta]MOY05345.1 immunoglobulin light chain junction region [Macaca mulatta]
EYYCWLHYDGAWVF